MVFTETAAYSVLHFLGPEGLEQFAPLVLATWLRALKHGNEFFGLIDNRTYFTVYSQVIRNILTRPSTMTRVAVVSDAQDVALGWSVADPAAKQFHFVYVKPDFRKNGIGTALFPTEIETITHVTRNGRAIWKKKFPQVKFNPF